MSQDKPKRRIFKGIVPVAAGLLLLCIDLFKSNSGGALERGFWLTVALLLIGLGVAELKGVGRQ